MLSIRTILIWVLFAGTLYSCLEDAGISNFDLNSNKLVIEGVLTNTDTAFTVYISRTIKNEETGLYKPVYNAEVSIREGDEDTILLDEIESGIYQTTNINGQIDEIYHLEIMLDGEKYSASERMYPLGIIDSIHIEYIKNEEFYEDGYYIQLYAKRISEAIHYYKLEISVNDSLYNGYDDLIIFEDSYTKEQQDLLIPYPFILEDTVKLKIYSLSKSIYEYFYALNKITTNSINSINSPSINPPTNFSNNPLGYFQVSAITELEIIIKE